MTFSKVPEQSNPLQLSETVDMRSPAAVWDEACIILKSIHPAFPVSDLRHAFDTILTIYSGQHPKYKACDTGFHDLRHTTDVFLGVCRLIQGAFLENEQFPEALISIGLIATLFHDSGYIQQRHETAPSGAFFSNQHVQRSTQYFQAYMQERSAPVQMIGAGCEMIQCSNLEGTVNAIRFSSKKVESLGRILKAGDLIAQMADRIYLEKLLLLYQEFRDAKSRRYRSEKELLVHTVQFYEQVDRILEETLPQARRWLAYHFNNRFGQTRDLYMKAIQNQRAYLLQNVKQPGFNPSKALRREGIADRVFGGSPTTSRID